MVSPMPPPAVTLTTRLESLPSIAAWQRDRLARLGLDTIADLLFHFPRTYEDLTDIRPIAQLAAGKVQTVQGEVVEIGGRTLPDGRTIVSIVISDDGKHALEGTWFNQPYTSRRFRYGQRVSFSGKPKWFRDHWTMGNPRVQPLDAGAPATPGIVPVYPLTEDFRPEHLRPLIRRALDRCAAQVVDRLPEALRERHGWKSAERALLYVHFPATLAEAQA